MPRLSEKQRQRIYDAVREEIMGLRIRVTARVGNVNSPMARDMDALISDAGHKAGMAAIRAALGKAGGGNAAE